LVASFAGVGPLSRLWSERTFEIRQQYWSAAVNIMNGLPFFGTGPDGFARYVSEFRPESYVELLGPVLRVSAAHNIALQFGAAIGWPGLILWLIAFGGALVFLFVRILRAPVASIGFTAAALGALVTYVIQGMVSIDMLPILTTGWIIAGLAIAAAREPIRKIEPEPEEPKAQTRRQKVEAAVKAKQVKADPVPVAALGIGAVLGLGGMVLVGVQMGAANAVQSVNSQEAALSFISNPLTPCPLRVNVTQQ
jgi:Lipid A core - O-antigen ligase and related enzymes